MTEKKLLNMRAGRAKVKGGILEADFCYEWIVFNLHSSLYSLFALHNCNVDYFCPISQNNYSSKDT